MTVGRRLAVALAAAIAVASGVAGCGVGPLAGGDARTLTVELKDAAGLFEGNDVGVLGVRVGEVTDITPSGNHVRVSLRVDDPDVKLPADVGAAVVSRSVATDRYVELTPVYDGGEQLADGAVLPLEKTATPVEFDGLLASLRQVSDALAGSADAGGKRGEGPLGRLLAATARTLDGNGASMRDGLSDLATVLGTVDDNLGEVEGTVDDLDTLTTTLAEHDALVRRFTQQVASATTMLDDQKEAVGATFDALAAMVKEVAAFVSKHQGRVDGQLKDFVSLATELNDHQQQLEGLLDHGPLMLQNLVRAIDENDRLAFRTRPISLVPGKEAALQLCEAVKVEACADLADLPVWDLLSTLAGVRDQ
ncbi:MCE family protein [Aeromicrobium sp. Root495]|uniref:MCE family protein n=1 Tax=Aeromicrobium sp. Root495 TaxID=1736550 RepID=UPI0007000F99|nr:MCE family protein [Aeromicrobium sp. Root495]